MPDYNRNIAEQLSFVNAEKELMLAAAKNNAKIPYLLLEILGIIF